MADEGEPIDIEYSSGESSESESSPIFPLEEPRILLQYAIHFVRQVRERLPFERFTALVGLLVDFHEGRKNTVQMIDEGNALLEGHPDLIEMFKEFCPYP